MLNYININCIFSYLSLLAIISISITINTAVESHDPSETLNTLHETVHSTSSGYGVIDTNIPIPPAVTDDGVNNQSESKEDIISIRDFDRDSYRESDIPSIPGSIPMVTTAVVPTTNVRSSNSLLPTPLSETNSNSIVGSISATNEITGMVKGTLTSGSAGTGVEGIGATVTSLISSLPSTPIAIPVPPTVNVTVSIPSFSTSSLSKSLIETEKRLEKEKQAKQNRLSKAFARLVLGGSSTAPSGDSKVRSIFIR